MEVFLLDSRWVTQLTMHEVMRSYLEEVVKRHGADEVAKAIGCSVANVNYMRQGYATVSKKEKTKTIVKRMTRYVDFQTVEALARKNMLLQPELLKENPILIAMCRDITIFVAAEQSKAVQAELSASPHEEKARRRPADPRRSL